MNDLKKFFTTTEKKTTPVEVNEGCTCHGCNNKYTTDLLIPSELWIRIYSEDKEKAADGGGLLCPTCIITRVVALGKFQVFTLLEGSESS